MLKQVWKDVFYLARRKIDPEGTPARPDESRQVRMPALTFYDSQYSTPVTRQNVYRPNRYRGGVKITELPD